MIVPPPPATLAVGPISGFGSIVVAGVHYYYDETIVSIVDGDGQVLTAAALTLGSMTRIDASEVTTVGARLHALPEEHRVRPGAPRPCGPCSQRRRERWCE